MNTMDGLVAAIFLMGVLMGAAQRLVRLVMSTLIALFVLAAVPAVYSEVGSFLSAMLGVSRTNADAVGFLLTAMFFIILFEVILRKSFEITTLPSLGFLDNVAGALVGLVWALLVANIALMPLAYLGLISGPTVVIPLVQGLFLPAATVLLRLIYPLGFAPVIDQVLLY